MILQNLRVRKNTIPDKICLSTNKEAVTYRQLYDRVCRMAYQLRNFTKNNALLLFHPDDVIGFTISFYACLMARVVAVPAPPQNYQQIQQDCNASAIVTSWDLYFPLLWSDPRATFVVEGWNCCARKLERWDQMSHELAFLQYTSGSTSNPKGVMITNLALQANMEFVCDRYLGNTSRLVSVTWVPFYHD